MKEFDCENYATKVTYNDCCNCKLYDDCQQREIISSQRGCAFSIALLCALGIVIILGTFL